MAKAEPLDLLSYSYKLWVSSILYHLPREAIPGIK